MSVTRLAVVVFVSTRVALAAQSLAGIALKVKVTDTAGNAIPRALIQARTSESRITSKAETDAQGEAVLYLAPDTSTISVRAAGFDGWQSKIDKRKDVGKPLTAVLRIESYYGPTLVNADPGLETEHEPPVVAVIPLERLASLVDLPGRKLRHHRHRHLTVD